MIDIYDMTHANEVMRRVPDGRANTLQSRMGTGGGQVQVVHEYAIAGNIIDRKPRNGGNGLGYQEGVSYTLNTIDRHAVCIGNGQANQKTGEVTGALNCMHDQQAAFDCGTVRRLTPLECERLQGLPDGWTAGGSDTARYKAIGNGMAQPCADFIMAQTAKYAAEEEEKHVSE